MRRKCKVCKRKADKKHRDDCHHTWKWVDFHLSPKAPSMSTYSSLVGDVSTKDDQTSRKKYCRLCQDEIVADQAFRYDDFNFPEHFSCYYDKLCEDVDDV